MITEESPFRALGVHSLQPIIKERSNKKESREAYLKQMPHLPPPLLIHHPGHVPRPHTLSPQLGLQPRLDHVEGEEEGGDEGSETRTCDKVFGQLVVVEKQK